MDRPFHGCHGSFNPAQVRAIRRAATQADLDKLYRAWMPGDGFPDADRGEYHEFWHNTVPEVREFHGREDRNQWLREVAAGLPGAECYFVWSHGDLRRASVRDELRLRYKGHKGRLAASRDVCEVLTTLCCWRADDNAAPSLREPVVSPKQCVELVEKFVAQA